MSVFPAMWAASMIFSRGHLRLCQLDMLMLESTYGNRRHDDGTVVAVATSPTVDKGAIY